jgi:ATP-dependent exoDNAse (exonuclease V) alpha subunit
MTPCGPPSRPTPTASEDQAAMVRDVCQNGAGGAMESGRAGTGKTFALGMARHAWQLDGYRSLATAPTGIATVALRAEGFEEVATCDRLLADLDHGREQLNSRTVLVVDEAGMLGSRKLARLLDHAQRAEAKVVLAATTGNWPRSTPAVASAPSASGLGPLSSQRTDGSSRPGNARP